MKGRIIKALSGFYYVFSYEDGQIYTCRGKGSFRKDKLTPLVGDETEFIITHEEDKEGSLSEIYPRSRELYRPPVANIDFALVIFSIKNPEPNYLLLDRFLIMMEHFEIPVCICINKQDLVAEDCEEERIRKVYEAAGYKVLFTSVYTGAGVDELRELLRGHLTSVAGPSGVGKSSLINAVMGREVMETGEISQKIKRGKQTTRHTELFSLDEYSFIVDTPGFGTMDLREISKDSLKDYFPEFYPYEGQCKFRGCTHRKEPDCAVREAVSNGQISHERYENYLLMYEQLSEEERYG